MDFLNLKEVNAPWEQELEQAALRVIRSGRYVGGPEVEAFETALAAVAGTRYAVGVSNGLDALRLMLRADIARGRLKPGDSIIVPANTYIATVLAIRDAGLTPVLADPDEHTMNLTGDALRKALTPDVRAVMTVHLYGAPAYDAEMARVIKEHGLRLYEDNAQAIGATAYDGRPTGSLGAAAAFSFYPTKNIGALGDAGAVTTDDAELARTVRMLANYGSEQRYHNVYEGFNCRLDTIQAAMLGVKLTHLPEVTARRREMAALYDSLIVNPLIKTPVPVPGHVYHHYVIRTEQRDRLKDFLSRRGIPTDILYPTPVHMQPCYSFLSEQGSLPASEKVARSVLSLPLAGHLSNEDIHKVVAAVNEFGK